VDRTTVSRDVDHRPVRSDIDGSLSRSGSSLCGPYGFRRGQKAAERGGAEVPRGFVAPGSTQMVPPNDAFRPESRRRQRLAQGLFVQPVHVKSAGQFLLPEPDQQREQRH
jgi:hypothetical protein